MEHGTYDVGLDGRSASAEKDVGRTIFAAVLPCLCCQGDVLPVGTDGFEVVGLVVEGLFFHLGKDL